MRHRLPPVTTATRHAPLLLDSPNRTPPLRSGRVEEGKAARDHRGVRRRRGRRTMCRARAGTAQRRPGVPSCHAGPRRRCPCRHDTAWQARRAVLPQLFNYLVTPIPRTLEWIQNRYILLQILLYAYLFYTYLPGLDEVGPLLAWLLLLLPMCVLNLIGTHKLKEWAARHQRQD